MRYDLILFSRSTDNEYTVKVANSLEEARDIWARFTGGGEHNTDTSKGHYYRMMATRNKKSYDVTKLFTGKQAD